MSNLQERLSQMKYSYKIYYLFASFGYYCVPAQSTLRPTSVSFFLSFFLVFVRDAANV